jgi:enolase-phosphatase E1
MSPPQAVVLDIEGTTSATAFVVDTLYPYAAERFAGWVAGHLDDPAVAQVRELIGEPDAGTDRIVAALRAWSSGDEKVTALKTIQGRIWEYGFASGDLVGHFYPDVLPALRRWHAMGIRLYVFSSGSVTAQRGMFRTVGDLIGGYFDTVNAGPKRDVTSYRKISGMTGAEPARTVFLSDVEAELAAAGEAGWQAIGVRRPGEPHGAGDVTSFDQLFQPPPSA